MPEDRSEIVRAAATNSANHRTTVQSAVEREYDAVSHNHDPFLDCLWQGKLEDGNGRLSPAHGRSVRFDVLPPVRVHFTANTVPLYDAEDGVFFDQSGRAN